jgi:hypothetical protein
LTVAYATEDELASYVAAAAGLGDASRLLIRASELLDDKVLMPFSIDDDTQLPTNTDIATALRDAACAQVEFWLEVGEEHDVDGSANKQVSIQGLNISELPPELAPRARRILHTAGLLNQSGLSYSQARFAPFFTGAQ